ncbi:MAG TPA: radical SAM protein, partial [Coriobacteriia bacterium]
MADNVGNADARPDLELEEEIAPDEAGTIDEQEMAEAEAGCGQTAVGVPMGGGRPGAPSSLSSGALRPADAPSGHPDGHPAGVPMDRQRHGGARSVGFRPGGGPEALAYQERTGIKAPRIIAWEITRSCNLSCAHCRAAAQFGHYHGELKLDEIKATIDDIVTISNPIIILTGGEPLMRPDIWEIVDYAHEKGAMPVIGTNATLLTDEIAQKMADHKIPRISVSVDFPTAEGHDAFRGQPGCFDATIEGIKIAK